MNCRTLIQKLFGKREKAEVSACAPTADIVRSICSHDSFLFDKWIRQNESSDIIATWIGYVEEYGIDISGTYLTSAETKVQIKSFLEKHFAGIV